MIRKSILLRFLSLTSNLFTRQEEALPIIYIAVKYNILSAIENFLVAYVNVIRNIIEILYFCFDTYIAFTSQRGKFFVCYNNIHRASLLG